MTENKQGIQPSRSRLDMIFERTLTYSLHIYIYIYTPYSIYSRMIVNPYILSKNPETHLMKARGMVQASQQLGPQRPHTLVRTMCLKYIGSLTYGAIIIEAWGESIKGTGPIDHINIRILHPGLEAQDKGGLPEACFVGSFSVCGLRNSRTGSQNTQSFQKSLIEEYTLTIIRIPIWFRADSLIEDVLEALIEDILEALGAPAHWPRPRP